MEKTIFNLVNKSIISLAKIYKIKNIIIFIKKIIIALIC